MKFTESQDIKMYLGGAVLRLVTDKDGVPIVNPTLAELKEYLPGYAGEEEPVYTSIRKASFGYTGLVSEGGKRIMKQSDVDAGLLDPDTDVPPVEAKEAKVSFIVEFTHNTEKIKGVKKITKSEKIRKLISFRFMNMPNIFGKGEQEGEMIGMFNDYGQFTIKTQSGYMFENFKDEGARPEFRDTFGLGFRSLIDFMYSYSTLTAGKYNLLGASDDFAEAIDWEAVFEGDASSIQDRFITIHESIKLEGNPVYGAVGLWTVTNNASTKNMSRQTLYEVFERAYKSKEVNTAMRKIRSKIKKSETPNKYGKVYSPASQGILVGINGKIQFGTVEFKEEYMDFLRVTEDTTQSAFDEIDDMPDF